MSSKQKTATPNDTAISRRRMLMRLGLGVAAAYTAPVLLQLSEARASSLSRPSRGSSFSAASFSRRRMHTQPQRVNHPRRRRTAGSSFSFSR